MSILSILSINIFSLFILICIFLNENSSKLKKMYQDRIFNFLLLITMMIIFLDSLGWILNGKMFPFSIIIYYVCTIINFIINPFIPITWMIYADYQLRRNETRVNKIKKLFVIPLIINAILVLLSPYYGTIFYIDSIHIYHRGTLFMAINAINYLFFIYTTIFVIKNKKSIHKRQYTSLVIFPLPMVLCSVAQHMFYGASLIWAGCTLSIIIVYISIQNKRLNTDYLTGLYNRRQLDNYLSEKINNSSEGSLFAAIMIDIDDFKSINDRFGHNVGDQALEYVADILETSFTRNDMVCRYAGDEFVVAFSMKKAAELEKKIQKLEEVLLYKNLTSDNPYEIRLSMGYDIYDYSLQMDSEQFMKHIDKKMYEKKNLKKQVKKSEIIYGQNNYGQIFE